WPVRRPSAISRSAWFVSSAVDLVYAHADELGHELVVAEMVGRDLAGHAALLDDQHAIRQAANEIEVLLDQHDGEPALALEREQDARDLLDDRGLDAFGRLVEQDELGLHAQAARQRQDLLLAARQHAARSAEDRLQSRQRSEDVVQHVIAEARAGGRHAHVVEYRQAGEDLATLRHVAEAQSGAAIRRRLRDLAAGEADPAGGGGQLADDGSEQGRLAHAVVAQDADELAGCDLKADLEDDRDLVVAGGEAADFQHGLRRLLAEIDVAHLLVGQDLRDVAFDQHR